MYSGGPNVRLLPVASVHKPVNHLDLLCGLSETALHHVPSPVASVPNAMNRQMRMRAYGNGAKGVMGSGAAGGGMPRHETKL